MATLTTIVVGRVSDTAVSTLNAVTDEHFTSTFDAWVNTTNFSDLGDKPVQAGTVAVKTSDNATTYTEGSDYIFEYTYGQVKVLSTGTMADATAYHVSYTYSDASLAVKINAVTTVAQAAGKDYFVSQATDGKVGVAVIVTEV